MSNNASHLMGYFNERISLKSLPSFIAKLVGKWDTDLENEICQQSNFAEFMLAIDMCYLQIWQIDFAEDDSRKKYFVELDKLRNTLLSCVPIRKIIGTTLVSRRIGGELLQQQRSVLDAVRGLRVLDVVGPANESASSNTVPASTPTKNRGYGALLASEKKVVYSATKTWQTYAKELEKDPAALAEFLSTLSEKRLAELPISVLQRIHQIVSKAIIKTATAESSDLELWSGLSVTELSWASSQLTNTFNSKSQKKLLGLEETDAISISSVNKFLKRSVGVELAEDEKKQLALIVKDLRASGATLWFGQKPNRQKCTLSSVFLSKTGKSCIKILTVGAAQETLWERYSIPEHLALSRK